MSEQKLNSIPNVEVNSVSHACYKPMLGAGASSSDDVSKDEVVNINISLGGYSVSINLKKIKEFETECPWTKNLKEEDYSKI